MTHYCLDEHLYCELFISVCAVAHSIFELKSYTDRAIRQLRNEFLNKLNQLQD